MSRDVHDRLVALSLAYEISEGRADFTVHGTPQTFIELLSEAVSSRPDGQFNMREGAELLGISYLQIEDLAHRLAEEQGVNLADAAATEGERADQIFNEACSQVLKGVYPNLKFVNSPLVGYKPGLRAEVDPLSSLGHAPFAVKGINVDFDRLLSMRMIRDADGG